MRFRLRILLTAAVLSRFGTPAIAQTAPSYVGTGSCTSSNCHGGVWTKTGGKINQNEYNVWSSKDKHSKSYSVLLEPRSRQIARNLKIEKPETAVVCLDCHATNVAVKNRGSSFDISDGVGCESCHGPASAWLGPHTTRNWSHQQSVRAGMIDTKDVKKRTEMCLSCHLGTSSKTVDHELIAAGHPDLVFELETFSALMPAHWRKENEQVQPLRRWAIAQPIALRESLSQLQNSSAKTTGSWPDFAQFDCNACHHALVLPSPRQERGYAGHPGLPPWNEARYVVLRPLMGTVSPSMQKQLDSQIADLEKALENPDKDKAAVTAAAQGIIALMNQALPLIEKTEFTDQVAKAIMRELTADAPRIAWAGMRTAEQATMSLDVLYTAFHPSREDPVNVQIGHLYDMLQSQATYDPTEFAAALHRLAALL